MFLAFKNNNLFSHLAKWLQEHSSPCFYKKNFGIECPGCGFQRSIIELLQANVIESIKQYPALIPLIFTFLMLIIHLIYHLKNGVKIIMISFYTSIFLIAGNFIYKLLF